MEIQPSPMPRSEPSNRPAAVAIIDWNVSGHHSTYLREYVLAFAERNIPVVVLSPEPPALDAVPPSVVWREIPTIAWMKKRQMFGMPVARWLFARRLAAAMRDAEAALGVRCSRVLFGCFYENQAKIAVRVMATLGLPAAGLYLQAGVFHSGKHLLRCKLARKVEGLFRQPWLETVFMLDEGMIETVAAFSGKPVVCLPDITDCTIDEADPLPAKLGLIPKTRPVIGLLGHLRPSKGVVEMIAFARSEPDLDATFLLAGFCRWAEFQPEEEELIKRAVAEDPRIIFHPERIPAETSYNALVRACDVLWAVYRDCPHSSNTLAKAACFERPVVVADGFLMARLARRYALGDAVSPGDAAALRNALLPMLADPVGWRACHSPRWAEFRDEHSNARFRSLLCEWALSRGSSPAKS